MNDSRMPLRSRLLAVPSLKARYLDHVRTLAEKSLDWKNLGPVVANYKALIEKEVEADTRKLYTLAAFQKALTAEAAPAPPAGRRPEMSLRLFADERRKYLLDVTDPKKLAVSQPKPEKKP